MRSHPSFNLSSFNKEQRLRLLFFYLANANSSSLIAYCIKHGLEKNDHDGVLWMLKNLKDDDESVILYIYGEMVLQLIKSL